MRRRWKITESQSSELTRKETHLRSHHLPCRSFVLNGLVKSSTIDDVGNCSAMVSMRRFNPLNRAFHLASALRRSASESVAMCSSRSGGFLPENRGRFLLDSAPPRTCPERSSAGPTRASIAAHSASSIFAIGVPMDEKSTRRHMASCIVRQTMPVEARWHNSTRAPRAAHGIPRA